MEHGYTENTRLWDILEERPWLLQVLPDYDERLSILQNPAARALTKGFTVADAARHSGYSAQRLLDKLERLIREHEDEA